MIDRRIVADLQRFTEPSNREQREERQRNDDIAQRAKLERRSVDGGRANRIGPLAAMAMTDSIAQRSLDGTMAALRAMAQGDFRNAAVEKRAKTPAPNEFRLYPKSVKKGLV